MKIKKFLYRLWINRFGIIKLSCNITGGIFAFWGLISLFEPLNGIFQDDNSFMFKLLLGFLVLITIFFISIIVSILIVLNSTEVCIGETTTKNCLYVKYGDMYSPDIVRQDYNGKRIVVIPVNRCFDTIVDDHLVSNNSQHGLALQRLYDSKRYTSKNLNREINSILKNNTAYKNLTKEEKPEGNRKRYDVGTTINLPITNNLSYYLLGLSYFDENLNAHTSKVDFVLAIQKLIEFCNQNAQGYPVILPLLGSRLSRTNIALNDILHYLVDAFAINKDIINNDFHIIVWKGDKDKIAIHDLRKWG